MHHALRRLLPWKLWDNVAGLPVLAAVVAMLLALGTLELDELLAETGLVTGGPLVWSVSNARALLGTLVGAIVTVAGFTFWMRAVMVQLVSSEFSPRILAVYLEDAFQRTVTAFMVGALMYVVLVLGAIPSEGEPVPVLSIAFSILVTLGSVVSILVAIKNGVRSLEVSQLVRQMTDRLIERIEAVEQVPTPEVDVDLEAAGEPILAEERGWVQTVEGSALLAAMAPGTTLRLDLRVGEFIDVGRPIGAVLEGSADESAVCGAIHVGRVRTYVQDLSFGFQQLVDVAEQALTTGSNDSTTAYEVIVHLGAALRALMRCGAPTGHVAGDDRCVLVTRALSEADLVREVIGRLRLEAAGYPTVAEHLLGVIAAVRDEAVERGRNAAVEELNRQAQRLLDGAEAAGVIPEDLGDLRRAAQRHRVGEHVLEHV